jgi:hypothetical protein
MLQIGLFAFDATEAIRLKVAAVTARRRFEALIRAIPKPKPKTGLQFALWGDPVVVGPLAKSKTVKRKAKRAASGPASVFEFAAAGVLPVRLSRSPARPETMRHGQLIERADGVAYRGASYGAAREPTTEEAEREQARRARQRPPKPPKSARTKSRKLLDAVSKSP